LTLRRSIISETTYNGIYEKDLSDEEMAGVYENRNVIGLLINQYVFIKNNDGKVVDKFRWDGEKFRKLLLPKISGFKPKTFKQECLCDMLMNPDIKIKIVAGVAGSGKSKLCIVFGLNSIETGTHEKMFVVRHNVSIGEKNGFLKGSKNEKIQGWLGFLKDNMDSTQLTIQYMIDRGTLEVEGVEYIKGRDIKNSWMLIDESEDLDENQFGLIGQRASEGSIICFVGDVKQVTQAKYRNSSGLKRAIDKLKGNPLVGIVVFDDVENDNVRSDVSKIFTSIY